jgi:hypothetical protein
VKVVLATLCLNEMEWLPQLYQQHKDWPGLVQWVFVEAADRVYAETNPELVSSSGLSVDGTTDYLSNLQDDTYLVRHVRFGIASHADPAQGKCTARQAYLDICDTLRPQVLIVIDADEFYTLAHQQHINDICQRSLKPSCRGICFKQRHIWYPISLREKGVSPLGYEVSGGYWDVPHVRVWIWKPGMHYAGNHNTPIYPGVMPPLRRLDRNPGMPQCVHMGFASDPRLRKAKHQYYIARGEGKVDRRQMYVDCRAAFDSWEPGRPLPHNACVVPYNGPVPEVFRV